MRIRLTYSIKNFPLAYRLLVMSVIKEATRAGSESFYQNFFVKDKKQTKSYSFAAYFPNFRIDGDKILSDRVSITISSDTDNSDFMIHLLNGSQVGREYMHGRTTMQLIRIEMLKEKKISRPLAWFQTMSPILVQNESGKPLTVRDQEFEQELNVISDKILHTRLGRGLYQPLKIEKCQLKKVVIKENFHQRFDNYLYFTANTGRFLLSGDPRDLIYFYKTGLGLRSQCFGLLEKLD